MEIGVIGMNEYAKSLCQHWIRRGHKILFADLQLYSTGYAIAGTLGPAVSFASPEKVAYHAEIVVLAPAPKNLYAAVRALGDVQQKIVVDLVIERRDENSRHTSFALIQRLLPEAKVVRITPDYPYPYAPGTEPDILYFFGNDQLAQRMVRWFVDGSGYKMIELNKQSIL